MPQFDKLIKDEIRRLARREVNTLLEPLTASVRRLKEELKATQRMLKEQQQTARKQGRKAAVDLALAEPQVDGARRRWSAGQLRRWREKLGLSAGDIASLLGVSAQTIYNWESGTTRPAADSIAQIGALKSLGKRQLLAALSASQSARTK